MNDVTPSTTAESQSHGGPRPDAATSPRWELEVRSPFLRTLAFVLAAIVLAVHIFMAVVVGIGDTGVAVSVLDQFAFVGIGILIAATCFTLLRPRVRANSAGVEVRNLGAAQFYPWDLVHGLSFPMSARTARLELPDFEFVPMMAFTIKDKDVADKVEAFRRLEDRYMPDE